MQYEIAKLSINLFNELLTLKFKQIIHILDTFQLPK